MNKFFKKIGKKILSVEIKEYEEEIRNLKSNVSALIDLKNNDDLKNSKKLKDILEQKCKLEKENNILRKYYDLDKEPSDEIKTKIHIDLEINKLKDDKQMLLGMLACQPAHIQLQNSYLPVWYNRIF